MLQPFTSESVTEGHPDKLADQISDAILDECLRQDAQSRVAVETLLTRGLAVVAGEITTHAYVEIPDVVRRTINEVGYTRTEYGFEGDTCGVMVAIQEQSPNIGQGVDTGGAGDQGMMFGYACNETPELMPLPITIAHALTRQLSEVRRANPDLGFRPDGKSQVTVLYENGAPKAIDTVVISAQHDPELTQAQVRERVLEHVVQPILARFADRVDIHAKHYYVNPTGVFVIGGPQADTGVTGRKSSSTPTAASVGTAAARSQAKTRPKLTVRRPTWRATWRKTSSPQGLPSAWRYRSLTQSAWRSPCRCCWRPSARTR
jgi:S-adenosylmethionine synthetase